MVYSAGGQTNPTTLNDTAPLILWIDGGPGCADIGNYLQVGPYNPISHDEYGKETFLTNGLPWTIDYHMLFVD